MCIQAMDETISTNLDLIHPVKYVEHFLEHFLQLQWELKTQATSTQQLQQVCPQLQDIVLPTRRQPTQPPSLIADCVGHQWAMLWDQSEQVIQKCDTSNDELNIIKTDIKFKH